MKFFVDTADVETIKSLKESGLIDGITTNPSLIAKSGRDFKAVITELCTIIDGPVSAEVAATDAPTMIKEGHALAGLAPNVVVKIPLTSEGLKACKAFSEQGIKTNVTLCFSSVQALLAAKVGATYVSPFIGRLDDIHLNGLDLIDEIRTIYDNYAFSTAILAASIRNENHVREAALAGADVATIPPAIIPKLAAHPLTDKGLDAFVNDWASTGQSIL